ncbi:MAG: bacillithiol biosynthesis cysteine-adding enzyme BshC [Chitinophagales bacterium]|nr:bacillithiol biosynthesis cysteine-adding enzyme BshC [Chitinophagales bacterium]
MQTHYLSYAQTGYFSPLVVNYVAQNPDLNPLYRYPHSLAALGNAAQHIAANFTPQKRQVLVDVLQQQYAHLSANHLVQKNIAALLQPNCLTVTTAHQPNLFTGHLYFIYKIVDAIQLSKTLQTAYPQYHFVPIYWMGSEDHDFEEINHAHIFGQTLQWQQPTRGAVGRLPTNTLQPIFDQLKPLLGNSPHATELWEVLQTAYLQHQTLADATQYLVNFLFGEYGLVVLNQDNAALKQVFSPALQTELSEQKSYQLVTQTNQILAQQGYTPQAFARPINLFYHTQGNRSRIMYDDATQQYYIQLPEGDIKYLDLKIPNINNKSNDTHLNDTTKPNHDKPNHLPFGEAGVGHLSPNVILRPTYQQTILPNIAYIGGGGELAYWLQQKTTIEAYGANYPVLMLRNSVLWIDKATWQKCEKLGLSIEDLFSDAQNLATEYVNKHSQNTLDLSEQSQLLQTAFEQILAKALQIDPTLQATVMGEMTKLTKSIETLEQKLLRSEKRKYETATSQIQTIKDKLFPNQSLQERYDNFIPYYLRHGKTFIATLLQHLNPLDTRFLVLIED